MGFRFRKRLRIIPGFLWVNVSKKGGSLSVGGHGLTANIFKQKFTGPFPIWLSDDHRYSLSIAIESRWEGA
jgi:hypothetical protein